jgi:hypothetical protein
MSVTPPGLATTLTDLGAALALAFVGGGIAIFWPWLQTSVRGHKFEGIIHRELEELAPHPNGPVAGKPWWEHATKRFVHEKIFEPTKITENRDFLLSLDPTVVYQVSQLWMAFEKRDGNQWLHYIRELATSPKVGSPRLQRAHAEWEAVMAKQPKDWLRPGKDDHKLREQLIAQATKAASSLYLETQRYRRAAQRRLPEERLEEYRIDLDKQYYASRIEGTVLESRLEAYFLSDEPRLLCHRAMDLLTVRYFDLTEPGGASERLLEINAGDEHSGLDVPDLRNPKELLSKYHATMRELIEATLHAPLVVDGSDGPDRALPGS